jgi:hypothetical protein
MVGSLRSGEFFFENIIDSLFFRPLKVPTWSIDLSPLAILQCFEDTVIKGSFESDVGAFL